MNLTLEEKEELNSHLKAIAKIVYRQTPKSELNTFEGIEKSLRSHMLEQVSPEIAKFFFQKLQELKQVEPDK